jgi:hypothetical protein
MTPSNPHGTSGGGGTTTSFAPLSIVSSNSTDDDDEHPTATATAANTTRTYYRGGFSTSLCDLFHDPYDRTSCCAITCCGTFLQDRNTFLLTGERPPPWWMRIIGYIVGFILATMGGVLLGAPGLFPLLYILGMAIRATWIRSEVRAKLQAKMAHARGRQDASTPIPSGVRSEHWCCALVPNDIREAVMVDRNNPSTMIPPSETAYLIELQRRQKADFCFQLWRVISFMCCDGLCHAWCHWCGMCATAQEHRELQRLLRPQVFWRDYITFEPFGSYYPQIQYLRHHQIMNFFGTHGHLDALSVLSRNLLTMLQVSILLLVAASTLHIVHNFSLVKVIIVVATLGQSFLILYVVYWRNHRLDVSLDAIIKYFASGFVLAIMVAVMVELILDMIGEISFSIALTDEYIQDHPNQSDDFYNTHGPFASMETFKHMARKHLPTLLIYLFFKAVVVAALVEELTKYFCFWMVEHPDFMYGPPEGEGADMEALNHEYYGGDEGEEGTFTNENGAMPASATSPPASASPADPNYPQPPMSPSEASTTMPPFRPRPAPNHTAAGAAITVGMIATAAGFSCSENLMYIFSTGSVVGGTCCTSSTPSN